jgi:hypothetical protein
MLFPVCSLFSTEKRILISLTVGCASFAMVKNSAEKVNGVFEHPDVAVLILALAVRSDAISCHSVKRICCSHDITVL